MALNEYAGHINIMQAGTPSKVENIFRVLVERISLGAWQVPKDLKITGIDGFDKQPKDEIPLTTYQIAFEELGRKAFGLLDALLLNKTIPELETRVRGEVVVRKSA